MVRDCCLRFSVFTLWILRKKRSMKALGTVTVRPVPGPRLARLAELASNLWWSWQPAAQALYREIDPQLWEETNHNPVSFLQQVSQQRLDWAAEDDAYMARYREVMAAFDAYMAAADTWYARAWGGTGTGADQEAGSRLIAYFSAEFGLHEALPIYSGGLGILSGDHCKAASDLGVPLIGVGFLYPQGYFQQRIDADGRQRAIYEKLDFRTMPAVPALDPQGREVVISVELPGRTVYAKVWHFQVGRVSLYLMDTDVEQNAPPDRELSARLYGGDHEMRIAQEVVLGIGGVRAVRALGLRPTVWHLNEGHAAFLQLERIREYVEEQGLPFAAALWAARANALFTTHTPVPAGHDAFPFELMDRFFGNYWGRLGLDREGFLALGRFDSPWGTQFSMTVLALRTSGMANGVSRLHGQVSRRMWQALWPEVPRPEVPIGHITNGVHTESWLHPGLASLFDRYLDPGWRHNIDDPAIWEAVARIPDAELWAHHNAAKAEMLALVRERVRRHLTAIGATPAELQAAGRLFDPDTLTIGFARRFATYKRATLLFRDRERLQRILNHPARPVQIIFAGKAHPADEPGKELIQTIYRLSRQPEFAGRIVFVEEYDINLARHLVAGVDLWLNTPRRPLEASGTSGQKAGLNGVPSCSILDGWWCEGYNGQNGWAIGQAAEYADESRQDDADALALYDILENEIVPLFYTRDGDGIPRGWLAKMRASIASIAPAFSLSRMLKEYLTKYYLPGDALGRRMGRDGFAAARALAEWEARVRAGWAQVSLQATGPRQEETLVGQPLRVEALLQAGPLAPDDLAVELVYGRPGAGSEPEDVAALPMHFTGRRAEGYHYEMAFAPPESGVFIYGVRVRPHHPDLPNPFALSLVRWA